MTAGNADTHKKKRQRIRRKLTAAGVPADEIDRYLDQLKMRQAASRRARVNPSEFDAHVDAWHDANRVSDRCYKPTSPDPLARGAARVTGATLKAAKRAKATTKYEHDQQESTHA